MPTDASGRVYWRRSEYLLHRVVYVVVSGLVAYGQSTEGVPAMASTGCRRPLWWRSYARAHLDDVEAFCRGVGHEQPRPQVEPPSPL